MVVPYPLATYIYAFPLPQSQPIPRLNVNANGRAAAINSNHPRGSAGPSNSKRKAAAPSSAQAAEDEEMRKLVALHNKKFKQESKYVPTLSFRDTRKVGKKERVDWTELESHQLLLLLLLLLLSVLYVCLFALCESLGEGLHCVHVLL